MGGSTYHSTSVKVWYNKIVLVVVRDCVVKETLDLSGKRSLLRNSELENAIRRVVKDGGMYIPND